MSEPTDVYKQWQGEDNLDHYGECTMPVTKENPHCTCLKPGPWRGRGCPHWKPLGCRTDTDLKTWAKDHAGELGYD